MGVKALPHAGIGVSSYAWSTSPLRRYTDLVNQWQIVACARHGRTAALAAPFKPKDAELFSIISAFDAAYSAYNAHQSGMERFWTLKHLQQQGLSEITARVMKDAWGGQPALARADHLPLVLAVSGAVPPRGSHVLLKLGAIDEIALDVSAQVLERLDADAPFDDNADNAAEAEDAELDSAGPLVIAVDAGEASEDGGGAPASEPAGSDAGVSARAAARAGGA
jgi:exoribonuclease-2